MVHWIDKICEPLTMIGEAAKRQVLESGYVLSDDTLISVLDKSKPGSSHRGYLWTYGNLEQVFYEYTPTRSREGPERVLKDYKGYLQTDGYQVYNETGKRDSVIHLGCWAHVRREFFEIKDTEPVRYVSGKMSAQLNLLFKQSFSNPPYV